MTLKNRWVISCFSENVTRWKMHIDFHKIIAIIWNVVISWVVTEHFLTKMRWYPQLYNYFILWVKFRIVTVSLVMPGQGSYIYVYTLNRSLIFWKWKFLIFERRNLFFWKCKAAILIDHEGNEDSALSGTHLFEKWTRNLKKKPNQQTNKQTSKLRFLACVP